MLQIMSTTENLKSNSDYQSFLATFCIFEQTVQKTSNAFETDLGVIDEGPSFVLKHGTTPSLVSVIRIFTYP